VNLRDEGRHSMICCERKKTYSYTSPPCLETLDWPAYINLLRPKGRLHVVGAAMEPIPVPVFPLLLGQKSLSASPLGSPNSMGIMLEFAARHQIEPMVEVYPMDKVNDAMEKLRLGKSRYRLVLKNQD